MSEHLPRFSLRSLFLGLTLIATVVGMGFNYPAITMYALLFLSPFAFVAVMASLANRGTSLARAISVLVVAAVIVAFLFLILVNSNIGG